jgi:hypothetical protein
VSFLADARTAGGQKTSSRGGCARLAGAVDDHDAALVSLRAEVHAVERLCVPISGFVEMRERATERVVRGRVPGPVDRSASRNREQLDSNCCGLIEQERERGDRASTRVRAGEPLGAQGAAEVATGIAVGNVLCGGDVAPVGITPLRCRIELTKSRGS